MTLPSALSDLDSDVDSEPDLSRLTLVVGALRLDIGLPANISIATFMVDVIDIANEQVALANSGPDAQLTAEHVRFAGGAGRWTLAKLGGDAIDPHRSLIEAGVYDGELLMIHEVGRPLSPLLFDDVEQTVSEDVPLIVGWANRNARTVAHFAIVLAATSTLAWLARDWAGSVAPACGLGLGLLGVAVGCVVARRPRLASRSAWIVAAALPLVFTCSLYVVPKGFGLTSIPMASALTALSATAALLASGRGRALYSAVMAVCVFAGLGALTVAAWQPLPRTVGALLATSAVIVVYLAPRVTIMLSKLPLPRVPTAGEPLDDIETQGGIAVEGVNAVGKQFIPTEEGLVRRVRRANEYLTGILVAAALTAAGGCYLAVHVDHGFFWQGTAFAAVVAIVLCLRGRSHHDLVQSATLIACGITIAVATIVKSAVYLDDWHVEAIAGLLALAAISVACGIIAPRREFSPVLRRQVEIIELIAIALVFPLCFWIIRLYAFFRELRI